MSGKSGKTHPRQQMGANQYQNRLLTKCTFETFVVGECNRFAHAAAQDIAENLGEGYKPLLIHSSSGSGKTHLLHAIWNKVLHCSADVNIYCISAERYMNEVINCLRYKKMVEFRSRIREADFFLIDGIQFMGGKPETQEEFLHSLNDLYEAGKQIVLTSDRSPNKLALFDEPLRSRFTGCLVAEIVHPDSETRAAIIRMKAELSGIPVPGDVVQFLSEIDVENVRELEEMLIRTQTYSTLMNIPITVQMVREIVDKN